MAKQRALSEDKEGSEEEIAGHKVKESKDKLKIECRRLKDTEVKRSAREEKRVYIYIYLHGL